MSEPDSTGCPAADDRALLEQHVAGDPTAFGELFRRHKDRLWAVALRTTGNPDDASDALQDAMIKAFRAAASFRGDAAVTTWLHRVVVNACLDLARRRAVRPTAALPGEGQTGQLAGLGPDPLQSHDLRLDVEAALAQLPPEQRAALVLVDMQGYSVEEAARILECAPGTIKSRCARGRARLLPLLSPVMTSDASRNPGRTAHVTSSSSTAVAQPEGGQPS